MSTLAFTPDDLTFIDAARRMRQLERQALKDKSYRRFPVGQLGASWLRSLRYAEAPRNTLESYEYLVCQLALTFPDIQTLDEFCTPEKVDELQDFLDTHWGEAAANTRRQRLAALRSFFRWGIETGRITWNPAGAIKAPKRKTRVRPTHSRDLILRLVRAQDTLRDQVAVQLLGYLGLRKNELRVMRLADVDLAHNCIIVHGKGGEDAVLPLVFGRLISDLELYLIDKPPAEYLLYPKTDPTRPMEASSVHRWFKRCLQRAGLPETWQMHELRHSIADELWRETGNIVLAQMLLRHKSISTTEQYLHPRRTDLVTGLEALERLWADSQGVRS